jgi:Xaa-Pro aminopeptidase
MHKDIYINRRKKLLQNMDKNSIAIIATNPEQKRNGDANYPFRAGSDFYYFTGFCEPNSVMILSHKEYIVFLQEKDKTAEMWNGVRLGVQSGKKELGAKTKNISKIKQQLPKIVAKYNKIYFDFNNIQTDLLEIITNKKYASLKDKVSELRVIKDDAEIFTIKKACSISDEMHQKAMQDIKNMDYEYQVQSVFDGGFSFNNATHAYTPIVAGGKNGLVLHYTENNQKLGKNDLILIDAGCEVDNYASDITRTFPISGKFSAAQKEIYNIVLRAQIEAIKSVKSGVGLREPHKIASQIIESGLKKLGILTSQKVKEFFPHGTSHFMGLDVHDSGEYKIDGKYRNLQTGMVITVEPGIYISKSDKIDKKYWDIAIRIEDDVLVLDDGCEVLTNAPKEIPEIEKIML